MSHCIKLITPLGSLLDCFGAELRKLAALCVPFSTRRACDFASGVARTRGALVGGGIKLPCNCIGLPCGASGVVVLRLWNSAGALLLETAE